jgi:hypothetical protein
MKRAFILAAALCVLALGAVSPASAQGMYTTSCPAGSQLVAFVNYSVTGESITGRDGTTWATANYTRTLLVFRVGTGNGKTTYCANWRDTGAFTTVGSTSPGGSGSVAAGITGTFSRTGVTTTFSAKWRPAAPTSGSLGVFASPVDWTSFYFDDVSGLDLVWYVSLFQTPANGAWGSRTGFPSYCDITSV